MTPFGHAGASRDMVGSFWLNMDLGGPPGTQFMTTFVTHVTTRHMLLNLNPILEPKPIPNVNPKP